MKTITDPDPKCPKCNSYDIFLIKPESKLGDYKAHCKDCHHTGNLDMFHCADPEKLLKAIYQVFIADPGLNISLEKQPF